MRRLSRAAALAAVPALAAVLAPAAPARPPSVLANRCVTIAAQPVFLKPTGIGTYMLHDREAQLLSAGEGAAVTRSSMPGPSAEWAVRRAAGRLFAIRSTATGRALAVDRDSGALVTAAPNTAGRAARFRLDAARGCRSYPEAGLRARGKPFSGRLRDGSVFGFADPHMHVAADLRGGGLVISGTSFDRFGITEALGRDADVHGPDGSLDFTGNLLRDGSPAGTHDTTGWPTFAEWPAFDTYTHQQVYYRWLQRTWLAGLRVLVAQAVEDEPLCRIEPRTSHSCDETATIELQVERLRALEEYVDAQSGGRGRGWFRLVYSPRAARRVIRRGKLAVVIGAESSNPFGCSQFQGRPNCDRDDIDRGIEHLRRLGVRTLFPAHWVDNALAGAALEGGDKGVFIGGMQASYTGEPFSTGPCPEEGQGEEVAPLPGRRCNTKPLTDLGTYAINRLMDNRMLIEVDHLSELARRQVLSIAEARGYPLVSSHTHTGGLWTESELRRLFGVGGFAAATLDDAPRLPGKILAFRGLSDRRPLPVGLATDTGGFAALPGPERSEGRAPLAYPFRSYDGRVVLSRQKTGERIFDLNTDGMAHYGLLPDLLADVRRRPGGERALSALFRSAEAYLRMWERATGR
jgi:microsomal dipeptidase-like Zn-dependent dipeptidase